MKGLLQLEVTCRCHLSSVTVISIATIVNFKVHFYSFYSLNKLLSSLLNVALLFLHNSLCIYEIECALKLTCCSVVSGATSCGNAEYFNNQSLVGFKSLSYYTVYDITSMHQNLCCCVCQDWASNYSMDAPHFGRIATDYDPNCVVSDMC